MIQSVHDSKRRVRASITKYINQYVSWAGSLLRDPRMVLIARYAGRSMVVVELQNASQVKSTLGWWRTHAIKSAMIPNILTEQTFFKQAEDAWSPPGFSISRYTWRSKPGVLLRLDIVFAWKVLQCPVPLLRWRPIRAYRLPGFNRSRKRKRPLVFG